MSELNRESRNEKRIWGRREVCVGDNLPRTGWLRLGMRWTTSVVHCTTPENGALGARRDSRMKVEWRARGERRARRGWRAWVRGEGEWRVACEGRAAREREQAHEGQWLWQNRKWPSERLIVAHDQSTRRPTRQTPTSRGCWILSTQFSRCIKWRRIHSME
jgi:hypothetical protein